MPGEQGQAEHGGGALVEGRVGGAADGVKPVDKERGDAFEVAGVLAHAAAEPHGADLRTMAVRRGPRAANERHAATDLAGGGGDVGRRVGFKSRAQGRVDLRLVLSQQPRLGLDVDVLVQCVREDANHVLQRLQAHLPQLAQPR